MCEYCRNNKTVSVEVEKGQKHRCQWDEYFRRQPYQPDPTEVMAADCMEPATQRVRSLHVTAHLCAAHKLCSMNEYRFIQEREPELNENREYLPIQASGFRCEALMQIRGSDQAGEQPGDDGILRCGKPATQLETYREEVYLCDEHARAFRAAEEAGNSDDLQHGRFLFNNKTVPVNRVICARKGC